MSSSEYPYVCTLTPELIEKAEEELNEKTEWRDRGVQKFREFVIARKGLKCPLDTDFLLRFLRARKFDYEKSYELLISYYTIRATNAEILKELTPSAIEHLLDSGISCVLPLRDKFGRKILYFRPGKWIPHQFPMIEVLRMNLINLEEIIKDEETQVNGVAVIANFADVGWTHLWKLDRTYLKLNIDMVQVFFVALVIALLCSEQQSSSSSSSSELGSFPMRFKALHLVNLSIVFGCIFNIAKRFLDEKVSKKLNFHGSSLDELHEALGKKCLPQELGGELPSGDELTKAWKKTLMEDEPMFQEMKKYKIEVSKNNFGNKTASKVASECIMGS